MPEPLIIVTDIVKRYSSETVLDRLNLAVTSGQVMVIIGPSGSGKSTLLRCIARLEPIQRGRIIIDGLIAAKGTEEQQSEANGPVLPSSRHDIGMVFQSYNLFPHLSVLDNITLAPRRVLGMSREEASAVAD